MSEPSKNDPSVLLVGGTGTTGRRVADRLRSAGATVRTAARHGADVRFDWDDPATHDPALEGVGAVYLVSPTFRLDHAPLAAGIVDRAERAGVGHVTFLSARGVEHAPAEMALRAIELDLTGRDSITSTILRPSWFMQNFSESFFQPGIATGDVVVAPTADGAEAFVDVDDIADVAAASLLDPASHAGAAYTLTGPEALTMADVAATISAATGRPVAHVDVELDEFERGAVAAGVPTDYAGVLAGLLAVVRSGDGARPTGDVLAATGHEPRRFADYVATAAAQGAWVRAA